MIQQRLSVLTIAANDLSAMKDFYESTFGWKPVAENKDIIFYQLNGFLLSLCKRKELTEFIGISPEGTGFRGVTFGYNVPTEKEVRDIYTDLLSKGVKLLNEPTAPPFGGLFFYFEDVEGNILEVAYNTFIPLDGEGNAVGHADIGGL